MKVKIGNMIYDSTKEPVMLILSDSDKKNIKNMGEQCMKYCSYPEENRVEEIKIFMKD